MSASLPSTISGYSQSVVWLSVDFRTKKGLISSHPAGRPSPAPFHFVSTTRSLTRRIKSQGSPGRQLTCSARKTFATLHSSSRWSCSPTITSAWDPLPEATFQLSHIPLLSHSLQTHPTKSFNWQTVTHSSVPQPVCSLFTILRFQKTTPRRGKHLFAARGVPSSSSESLYCVRPLHL
jgi:hypothetical protein